MNKHWLYKFSALLMVVLMLSGQAHSTVSAMPNLAPNSKVLITDRAIATWPSGIPAGETRPVIVFLPGWGGVGAVKASVSGQNTNLVNQGYVTLAIGFDSSATWESDIAVKTAQGLDALCADASIPANCDAIVIDGSSYGGAQNYWVIEYLLDHGYAGKALGFLSEDAGYGAPGYITDYNTGAYTRTGLADTASYSVAMIENLGDITFPVDECTWGNCGARELGDAHQARGDANVFSICPPGGSHGNHSAYPNWNAWVISAIKTIIHVTNGIPTFTGYTNPTLSVNNACVTTPLPGPTVSSITRASADPTSAAAVNFTVTFSASVTGVDAADFALATTGGVSGVTLSGVSGSGAARTVTVNTGSGNGTIRLDLKASGTGIVDALNNPISGGFTGGQVYTVNKPQTLTLQSEGAYDGWMLESTETSEVGGTLNASATTLRLGDNARDRQSRAILHFDTSALPDDAVITNVTLKIKKQGLAGTDPFTILGGLTVDMRRPSFGALALALTDFQASAPRVAVSTFGATPVANWYSAILNASGRSYVNKTGTTQFRLRFATDDNDNAIADFVNFFSGNAAAGSRPQLIVEYKVP
jgi:hypothetical protein